MKGNTIMTIQESILELGALTSEPSVTISFNTNRTHPENEQDRVVLKNLISEAQERILDNYDKSESEDLLKKLTTVSEEINHEFNLESMHIFLSNDTQKVIKTTWPVLKNSTYLSDKFALRSLIEAESRTEEYLILLLSQGGVTLYEALNDSILNEIENSDFPFPENSHLPANAEQASDSEKQDNLVREYLNKVDKALLNVSRKSELKCVVICTEDNYSKLMQISDDAEIYLGHAPVDYNKCQPHEIVKQSWEIVQGIQAKERADLLKDFESATPGEKLATDLEEIYQAAIDGRGDVLLINQEFNQSVKMTSDRTFELIDDPKVAGTVGDIVNAIAWEVVKNKGSVIFGTKEELENYGNAVLKTRY